MLITNNKKIVSTVFFWLKKIWIYSQVLNTRGFQNNCGGGKFFWKLISERVLFNKGVGHSYRTSPFCVKKTSVFYTQKYFKDQLNPFSTNVSLLYPLTTLENLHFLFSGGIEAEHWLKMGWTTIMSISNQAYFQTSSGFFVFRGYRSGTLVENGLNHSNVNL